MFDQLIQIQNLPNLPDMSAVTELARQNREAVLAGALASGLIYCFLGYLAIRILVGTTGFALGAAFGAAIASWLAPGNIVAVLIVAGILGFIGAIVLFFVFRGGVFVLGSMGGGVMAHAFLASRQELWAPLAIIGIAACVGLVAVWAIRPFMIVATSAIGASILIATGVVYLTGKFPSGQLPPIDKLFDSAFREQWFLDGAWLMLFMAGVMAQTALSRKKRTAPPPAVPSAPEKI